MEKTKENSKEEQNKVKRNMKLWKKLLIIILIILSIFLIDTFRKFVIIRKVVNQYNEDNKSTNYYTKTIGELNGAYTEIWRLGNKHLLKRTSYEQDGIEERMIYTDKDKKEQFIIVNTKEEKVAVKLEYNEENMLPLGPGINGGLPSNNELWAQLICSVWAKISKGNWAEEECYKIKFNSEYIMWVSKDNMRIVGEINGTSYTKNKEKTPNVTTHIVKLNETTKENMKIPDLTGYIVKDNKGNIIK